MKSLASKTILSYFETLFPLVILSFLSCLYIHHNYCIPLTVDELGSWGLSLGNPDHIVKKTLLTQGQGPTYFVLLSEWIANFGDSKESMRYLSLILHLVNFALLIKIGKSMHNTSFANLLTAAYYISPVIFSNEILARPYALAAPLLSGIILCSVLFAKNKNIFYLIPLVLLLPLLTLTHYLYLFSLPPIFLIIILISDKCHRTKNLLMWSSALILIEGVTLLLLGNIIFAKASSISDLVSAQHPTFYDLLSVLAFSSLGVGILAFIMVKITMRLGSKESEYIPLLFCGLVGILFCYLSLYFLPNLVPGTFFLPRYFSIASFYGALFLATLICLYSRVKWAILTIVFTFYFIENYYHHHINGCSPDNMCKVAIESILNQQDASCKLYASTGFIELQNPEYLENIFYKDFLEAPISYYTKRNLKLLPISISNPLAREFFDNKILPNMAKQSCLLLYPNNDVLKTDQYKLEPIINEIEIKLKTLGFSLSRPLEGCSLILAKKL